jgi:hypothetical protein
MELHLTAASGETVSDEDVRAWPEGREHNLT